MPTVGENCKEAQQSARIWRRESGAGATGANDVIYVSILDVHICLYCSSLRPCTISIYF